MTTYKEIFGKPIKVLTGDPAPTPITYTVTVANPGSGNRYYIDGVLTPTLELYEGNTYNFDYSGASSHPFRFSTTSDGTHNSGTEYTTGVSVDSNITTIVVASGAPNLFYYCSSHSGMGGIALTPAGPTEYEGQIWYNETTGKFRSVVAGGAWSSAANLSTARYGSVAAGNTQNAALVSAGTIAGPYAGSTLTEEYNGTGWTGGGAYPTAGAGLRGCGTLTAALGVTTSVTNYYNGTAWTAQPSPAHNLPTTKSGIGMCGTQTAAVAFGGYVPGPNTRTNATEEYDGEGWTATNTMPSSVSGPQGFGIQTAAVSAGGDLGPANTTANAEYNGTSWTAATAVPVAIKDGFACGTQTAGMLASGAGPSPADVVSTNFLSYDGTSWATIPSMATSRRDNLGGSNGAPNISTVQGGGNNPPTASIANTEEYNFTANTVTAAAWAAGGTMNTATQVYKGSSTAGTQNAFRVFGGYTTANTAKNEAYNGSTWSEEADMNTARRGQAGSGTSASALCYGGFIPPSTGVTEEWNGTSWSEQNDLNTNRNSIASAGSDGDNALATGGNNPSTAAVEQWNGTSWTAKTSYPISLVDGNAAGTVTAAVVSGGYSSPPAGITTTNEWNGSSWTAGGPLVVAIQGAGSSGTSTAALMSGGYVAPAYTAVTQVYDGTAYATQPSLGTARGAMGAGGPSTANIIAGGYDTGSSNKTEEFTGETTSLNTKNISSS